MAAILWRFITFRCTMLEMCLRRPSFGSDSAHNKSSVDGSSNSSKSSGQKSSNETRQKKSKKSTGSAAAKDRHATIVEVAGSLDSIYTRALNRRMTSRRKNKTSKTQVLRIPASQLTLNATTGDIWIEEERRSNGKDSGASFKTPASIATIHPQSDATRDVVLLRGYDIIADVTNMNRNSYSGWELSKRKRGSIANNNSEQSEKNKNAKKNVSPSPPPPITSEESNEQARKTTGFLTYLFLPENFIPEAIEQELAELQKQKLLKEIATQQQQIIEEQRILDRKASSELVSPLEGTPVSQSRRASRRSDVIEKYDRVREEEEMKMTKYMTHLNRRRKLSPAQEIAPKSGKKRRQNHEHFAALEGKLNEMKEKLGKIDNEIHTLQANKQSALEKIRERQDLELLLAEQQESLAIMRRHDNDPTLSSAVRHRHRTARSREALTSIDEISSISDCCSSVPPTRWR
ncbi:unnamed protein product [Clavelina lepadiformis]|uniref:Uncharacterized protein n=1 Tax=Clavelina lepadiformis TaxID=159417 RepID=A0ABP0FH65_CLALP